MDKTSQIEKFTKIHIKKEADYLYDSAKFAENKLEKYKSNINTKPLFNPHEMTCFDRSDEASESLSNDEALLNTKHKKSGFFKVVKPF